MAFQDFCAYRFTDDFLKPLQIRQFWKFLPIFRNPIFSEKAIRTFFFKFLQYCSQKKVFLSQNKAHACTSVGVASMAKIRCHIRIIRLI
jgi:hypothetical protein